MTAEQLLIGFVFGVGASVLGAFIGIFIIHVIILPLWDKWKNL